MYKTGDGHVLVLAAGIRHLDHLLASFALEVALAAVPAKVMEKWPTSNFPMPASDFTYQAGADSQLLKPITYKELNRSLFHGSALISLMSSQLTVFRSLWLTIVSHPRVQPRYCGFSGHLFFDSVPESLLNANEFFRAEEFRLIIQARRVHLPS